MPKLGGKLLIKVDCPYVYFIQKGRYLYIGETQSAVVIRWGAHLSASGTFLNAINSVDPAEIDRDTEIRFLAFECNELATIDDYSVRKRTTQYLESQLHVQTVLNARIGPAFEIISNTIRTAPTRCDFPCIKELAISIIDEVSSILV